MIIIGALFVFKDYLLGAFYGRWKNVGDSFGLGRQYDAQRTTACAFDHEANTWYDESCYDNARVVCDSECQADIRARVITTTDKAQACIFDCEKRKELGCQSSVCNDTTATSTAP